MIDPGKMDRRVLVQKPVGSKSPSGQVTYTWENAFPLGDGNIWAMVHTDNTNELFHSDKKTATRRKAFVTRYFEEITEEMTIIHDNRRYDITGIEEIGRREGLSIKAEWTQGKYDE